MEKNIVELTVWLHDISSIIYGRKNHHLTGADIVESKLWELDYPSGKIETVKECILCHRGSIEGARISVEAKIFSDADAIANFNNISGIFLAAFIYEHLSQEEAKKPVRERLQRKWNKLKLEQSREMVKPKYEAVMLLLGDY